MKSILVTGASSGIGRATALRLTDAGHRVFATVRTGADRRGLEDPARPVLRAPFLDVTDADSIAACASEVSQTVGEGGLDGLVNNAGAPFPGPLELLPLDDFRDQLEVNLTGQVAVTQAFLPLLRRARGRIVFVSSLGGRVTFPFAGAYHASKFGLEAVGEVLRQELRGSGVEVCLVEPGTTESAIWEKSADRTRELLAGLEPEARALYANALREFERRMEQASDGGISADAVAEEIESALTAPRSRFRRPIGLQARALTRLRPLIPDAVFDLVTARLIGR